MTNATTSRRRNSTARRLNKLRFFADIGYEPHPGQLAVHRSTAPRRVLACGVRWGKTMCGAMEALAAAMQPAEHSLGWLVGPSYELAGRAFREVRRVVESHLSHRIVILKSNSRRIVLRNMGGGVSEIRCKSADRPDSLLGEGLDWLVVDEAARLNESVWARHLSQRLIDRDSWALLMSTPSGSGWFKSLYVRGQGADPGFESWRAPSWENPFINREAIEAERERLSPADFAREYEARFIDGDVVECSCGFPNANRCGVVVVASEEELLRCTDCGNPIDEDGRGLGYTGRDGTTRLKVIVLPGRENEPELERDGVLDGDRTAAQVDDDAE